MSEQLKVGDRIQVVLVVAKGPDGGGFYAAYVEGSDPDALTYFPPSYVAHGTLLPPKPKPLQVGDRVTPSTVGAPKVTAPARIVAIDGNDAWLVGVDDFHWTEPLSDLTRVDDNG